MKSDDLPVQVLQAVAEELVRTAANKVTIRHNGEVDAYDFKMGHSTVILYIDHAKRLVYLTSLRVSQKHRGQGEASRALSMVVSLADRLGYDAKLDASPLDKKTSTAKLVRLYQKFGFQPTGRRINLAGDPEMLRRSK